MSIVRQLTGAVNPLSPLACFDHAGPMTSLHGTSARRVRCAPQGAFSATANQRTAHRPGHCVFPDWRAASVHSGKIGYNRGEGACPLKLALEISPQDVKRRLDAGEAMVLLDVREPSEYAICSIHGAQLLPMNTVPGRLPDIQELAQNHPLVIYCHHGVRSLNVAQWLQRQGIENCQSMEGGIERWSLEIDPAVPRY